MIDPVIQLDSDFQIKAYTKYPLVAQRGQGSWLEMSDGRRYLDMYGGHAVAVTGHCHPKVVSAIRRQSEELIFYSNLVYLAVRSQAAKRLIEAAPPEMDRVFFINSGAEANENALGVARFLSGRKEIVSFRGSFHGRTLAALSATGIEAYRQRVEGLVPFQRLADFGDLASLEAVMNDQVAAVILEPIQSMAGVCTAEAEFFQGLRTLCNRHGALLIYDEIQTGMGRTGQFCFAPRYQVSPDMITLAKGLASGIPMGALMVSTRVADGIGAGDLGSTFGGGPIACAALLATLEVIEEEGLLHNVTLVSRRLRDECRKLRAVQEVRGTGFLLGIVFENGAKAVQRCLRQQGVLSGLAGDSQVLRLLPPLTLKPSEADYFLGQLKIALETAAREQ